LTQARTSFVRVWHQTLVKGGNIRQATTLYYATSSLPHATR